ncbi:MAG: hypothetical protein ACJ76Z_00885 [Thermoleophilaceae bacterium]
MRRLVLIACLAALLAAGTTTTASAALKGGIGDQNASTFSDPAFRALHVHRTRLIVAYDAIFSDPGSIDTWMAAARAAHADPLVAFNPSRGSKCPKRPCKIPSKAAYTRAFKAFRKRYPKVKLFQFWNETNSGTQPTGPTRSSVLKKTAALYVAAKRVCGRKCTVTGPDILDQGIGDKRRNIRVRNQKRMQKWIGMFLRYAGRRNYPTVWGFHNYGDTNYFRSLGTAYFLHSVAKRGQIWVTETGGDYAFRLQSGQVVFKPNAARQKKATKYAYTIAKKYRSRIKRLYYYQWKKNNPNDYFDAAIRDLGGPLRPAYAVLKKLPRSFWR